MNMHIFKHTIWIDRPREAVFDYFTDFSKASEWRQYVRAMEPADAGRVRAGSRVHVTMDLSGDEYAFDLEVLVCERPSLWRHRTNETDFRGFIEYRFDEERGGTRVTLSFVAKPVGLYGWLAAPLVWMRGGKSYREQLPRLKHMMEAA